MVEYTMYAGILNFGPILASEVPYVSGFRSGNDWCNSSVRRNPHSIYMQIKYFDPVQSLQLEILARLVTLESREQSLYTLAVTVLMNKLGPNRDALGSISRVETRGLAAM